MKLSRYNVWAHTDQGAVVFNGVSGAVLQLPEESVAALEGFVEGRSAELALSDELVKKLALARAVVADDCDELDVLRRRYQASREATDHFALTIVPSMGCNFDCPYCFENKPRSLLNEDAERILVGIVERQLEHVGALQVNWFGGEPLMGRETIFRLSKQFMAMCAKYGATYDASLITNGSLLTPTICQGLKDAGVSYAQVTLDGPEEIHNLMRPLLSGRGTFRQILHNVKTAVDYFHIGIRINVDAGNVAEAEQLLAVLKEEGLAGRVGVGLGQLVAVDPGVDAPSTRYRGTCLARPEFAQHELRFNEVAAAMGFGTGSPLPGPMSTPCTAVRKNELIVGSRGELYKCWETVGSEPQVVGHLQELGEPDSRAAKWLEYDPFSNAECAQCIALPVCMGGCAHHAMDPGQYANRCGSFRFTYQEQVAAFAANPPSAGGRRLLPVAAC